MARRFRLATVQRLRGQEAEDATIALGRARAALAAAHRERDDLTAEILRTTADRQATSAQVQLASLRREALREALAAADLALLSATAQVETAVADWHHARSRLRAVETLHERHREQLAAADARSAQLLADEFAGRQTVDALAGGAAHHAGHGPAESGDPRQ